MPSRRLRYATRSAVNVRPGGQFVQPEPGHVGGGEAAAVALEEQQAEQRVVEVVVLGHAVDVLGEGGGARCGGSTGSGAATAGSRPRAVNQRGQGPVAGGAGELADAVEGELLDGLAEQAAGRPAQPGGFQAGRPARRRRRDCRCRLGPRARRPRRRGRAPGTPPGSPARSGRARRPCRRAWAGGASSSSRLLGEWPQRRVGAGAAGGARPARAPCARRPPRASGAAIPRRRGRPRPPGGARGRPGPPAGPRSARERPHVAVAPVAASRRTPASWARRRATSRAKTSRATAASAAPGACRSRRLAAATVLAPVARARRPRRQRAGDARRPSWRSSRSRGRS